MSGKASDPQAWIDYALEDLEVARRALATAPPIARAACFHAQQCAEKVLKAFLVCRGQKVPRIHDLDELRLRCTALDSAFADIRTDCNVLNEFGSPSRYPPDGKDLELTVDDAKEAMKIAERVAAFVRARLKVT
jgi:HEPN domain-containing protein